MDERMHMFQVDGSVGQQLHGALPYGQNKPIGLIRWQRQRRRRSRRRRQRRRRHSRHATPCVVESSAKLPSSDGGCRRLPPAVGRRRAAARRRLDVHLVVYLTEPRRLFRCMAHRQFNTRSALSLSSVSFSFIRFVSGNKRLIHVECAALPIAWSIRCRRLGSDLSVEPM